MNKELTQADEAKVELAGLDVLLPEGLGAGDNVHAQGGAGGPHARGPVQQVRHRRAALLHAVVWNLTTREANCNQTKSKKVCTRTTF